MEYRAAWDTAPREIPRRVKYRAAWDTVQGDCGSCYAVAVADMITARVAVQTNNSVRQLPHPHRDWAHRCHICSRSGQSLSIPGLGSPPPRQPHRDWARSRKASVVYGSPLFGATISRKASDGPLYGQIARWLMGSQSMRMGGLIDRFLNGV